MSQGHDALPRPRLELGLSNSEPSALTTGLLNKAVALACLQYSWPHMLKVAPCTVIRLYIQIVLAWWVATILYNYGATLCELHYQSLLFCFLILSSLNFYNHWCLYLECLFCKQKQLFRATNHPDFLEIGFLVSHKNGYILVSSFFIITPNCSHNLRNTLKILMWPG